MKKIKYIFAALVMLLIGVFATAGCDGETLKLTFLDNAEEIRYSVYPSDELKTHVTDKKDIAEISSFFSDTYYKKIKADERYDEGYSTALLIETTSEENTSYISVYPDGHVIVQVNGTLNSYVADIGSADYEGLLAKMEELRAEYEHAKNTYFLRDVEGIMFLLSGFESSHTVVTDKADQDKIISILSAATYRERLYGEEVGTFTESLMIDIWNEDCYVFIYVYPENFVSVQPDGAGKFFITDVGSVDYDEMFDLLTKIREESRKK